MLDVRSLDCAALALLGLLPPVERKFNPEQLRVPGGEHGGEWAKGGGAGAALKDALNLSDRIDLDPSERLVSSSKISDSIGDHDLVFAVTHGPENAVRIGLVNPEDSTRWRAANKGGTALLNADELHKLRSDLSGGSARAKAAAKAADGVLNSGAELTDPVQLGEEAAAEGRLRTIYADLGWDFSLTDGEPVSWNLEIRTISDQLGESDPIRLDPKKTRALLKHLDSIQSELDDSTPSRSAPSRGGARMDARAQMSASAIDDLPDSAFAYIEPGGSKDAEGKTVPRSKRHFPIHDAVHVRNALARAPQSPFGDQAMPKIRAAAKKYGIDVSGDSGRSIEFGEDRYNDQHAPAGSATGGQFTSGGGSGGGAKKPSGKQATHARPGHRQPMQQHRGDGTLAYDPGSNHGTGYDSKQGDERVHALQQALNRLGVKDSSGKPLRDDGQLGPKTTSAVKKLQTLLGLKPDGKVTPALLKQITSMKSLPHRRSALMEVCVRSFGFQPLEARSSDGRTLEGYAAVFNSPTTIRDLQGDFEETILPGAFKRTLGERTPLLQWDHGKDPRVGTAPIGDIEDLREDDHGLYVRAHLYDHPDIERIRMAIAGRSVKGMSFRFGVPKGGDDWPTRDQRQIRDLDAYELGPVAFPAYDATSVTVRSLLAQLDPDEHRSLIRELAAELRLAVDLSDLTGASDARSADRGDIDLQPGSGGGSRTSIELRRLEAEALHALGAL